jgi:hypothetical protein
MAILAVLLLAATGHRSGAHAIRDVSQPTVFGPALVWAGEKIVLSAFNSSNQTVGYRLEIRDALNGELIEDIGMSVCEAVRPRNGCSAEYGAAADILVVITIISTSIAPSDSTIEPLHAVGDPGIASIVSAQIVDETTLATRLLPAVQAARRFAERGEM